MKGLSRLTWKVGRDGGLPLLFASYALGGFIILTHYIPKYWNIASMQYPRREILLSILLSISLFFSLYLVFRSGKLRQLEGRPPQNSGIGGMETAIRGITIFLIFYGITTIYWWVAKQSHPVTYGIPPTFAAVLILIDWAHRDWKRKYNFGVLPRSEDKYDYTSKLEFLRILHSNYTWNTKVCVYIVFAFGITICWGATQFTMENMEFFDQLKWTLLYATYGSAGLLLIVMQFFRATLHRIEREILELKK